MSGNGKAPDLQLRPLRDRVLVLPDVRKTETDSGLVLVLDWNPDTTGTVAFVGAGSRCAHCGKGHDAPVREGDHVIFSYTRGTKVTLEGTEYLVLTFDDILGVLEDDA